MIAERVAQDAVLAGWLRTQTWSDFAQSLADFFDRKGYLTDKQVAAATSMRDKVEANARAKAATEGEGDFWETVKANIPAGRYAVDNGEGATAFYRIDRPTEGKWAGYVFIKVMASDDLYPVRGAAARKAFAKILEDPRAAAIRYGIEIGECSMCGRTLTDEDSRAAGIGPVCARKNRW